MAPPGIRHDPNSAYMEEEEEEYGILGPGDDDSDDSSESEDEDMQADVVRLVNTSPQPVKPAQGSAAYKAKKKAAKSEPNEYDVYMGRGGLMNRFRNGSLYRKLILEKYESYKHAPFKRDFALDEIVKPVQAKGGRFFIPSPDLKGWVQGDIYEVIAPKVMQALRDCYKDEGTQRSSWSPPGAAKSSKKSGKKPKGRPPKKRASASSSTTPRKRQATAASKAKASSYNHPSNKIRQRIFAAPAAAPTPSPQTAKNTFGVKNTFGDSTPSNGSTPLRHNLLMSLGASPKGAATTTQAAGAGTAAASQANSPTPTPDPKKRVLLNEKGHMMNTVQRTTGVCGFYHFLLSHHAQRFAGIDELEEGQFVWDNIVSPIQKQGGTILVCPKSGKVQTEVNHKTIICIANALRDKEYIEEECANPYGQAGGSDGKNDAGGEKFESTTNPKPADASMATTSEDQHLQQKKKDESVFAAARNAVMGIFKKEETPSKPVDPSKPKPLLESKSAPKPLLESKSAAPPKKNLPGAGSYTALKAQADNTDATPPPSVLVKPKKVDSAAAPPAKASATPAKPAAATAVIASNTESASTTTKDTTATAAPSTAAATTHAKVAPDAAPAPATTPAKDTSVATTTAPTTTPVKETPAATTSSSNGKEKVAESKPVNGATKSVVDNTVKKVKKEEPVATRKSSRIQSGGIVPASNNPTIEPRPTRSNSHVTAALTTRPKRQVASVTPEQSSAKPQPSKHHAKVQPTTLKRGKSQETKQDEGDKQSKMPWEERFSELIEYAKKNGDSNVAQRNEENPALGRFVKINRQYWMRNRQGGTSPLTPEREALLDAMGFQWNMLIERKHQNTYNWDEQLRALKVFKKKWGHCDVPLDERNTRLARWVAYMRKLKSIDRTEFEGLGGVIIPPDWEKKLYAVGFNWRNPNEEDDEEISDSDSESIASANKPPVEKIKFTVPVQPPAVVVKPEPKPSPAAPVAAIRTVTNEVAKEAETPKTPEVVSTPTSTQPNSVNINVLSGSESDFGNGKNWSQCFKMLSCFKDENGHTQVPYRRFPHNHPLSILSKFVMQQRVHKALKNRKQPNNLTEEREKILNSIGFEWRTKYECTKEGSKALARAGNVMPANATPALREIARTPKGEGRKDTKPVAKPVVKQPEVPTRTIVDSQGTKWTTYKPLSVDSVFNVSEAASVPARPPTPENWGVEMTFESDDDSVTF